MENALILSLIQNAAVLIAMSVLFDLVTHHHLITKSILVKVSVGVYIGFLGIILLLLSHRVEPDLYIDTRSVLLSVTGLFFGGIPTIVAMIIILIYRIYEGGQSIWIGIAFIITSGTFGMIVRHFWFKKLQALTRIEILMFAFTSHLLITIILVFTLEEFNFEFFKKVYFPTLILFPIITATLCFLLQHRFKRDQISEQLIDNNRSLNLALNTAELLFFDQNLITKSIYWSDPRNQLLVDLSKKNNGHFEEFHQYVHPDDLDPLTEIIDIAIQSKESIQKDLRIINTNNSIKWVHFVCQYIYNKTGTPIRVIGVVKDITMEKRTEESLAESEYRFRTILENAPDGIFVNTHDSFAYINPKMISLLHAKDETELLGTSVMERVSPEYRDAVKSRIEFQKETGNNAKMMEQEYLRMDGSKIAVTTTAAPIKYQGIDSILVFVHDLSNQKKTEAQIKKLSLAVEQSPVSIIIADLKGTVEYVNPKFSELTGYSLHEIVGKNPRVLKSDFTSDEEYKVLWETIISGKVWSGVFKNIKKDGSEYWESATISPIKNEKGEITHYIGIKEDITEKKQIYADLTVANNKAEESNQLKSHFLANMSHEIRTPLNGILGFLDLIKDYTISESERNGYIDIVSKSGVRLLETINDIIEMSKIEAGSFNLDIENINLCTLIHDLICFFKPQTDEKGVILKFENPNTNSEALHQFATDKNKLNGILTNIIKNAIKFTHKGSIEVSVDQKENGVLIKVQDTGIGIPDDKITSIFGRFIQADITNSRGYEGSGLGLSISKAYVDLLNGKIWVESEVGTGSTFFLFLPFLNQQTQKEIPSVKSNITKTNIQESYTVLVAEDEEDNFQYLRILLQKLGVTILWAVNGLEAVRLVQETEKIDIVLMDIKMPEMSGIEAVKEIRTFNKKIPIIGQSAFFMDSNDNVINENGFTDYIMKPIKKEQLYQILKKYLD